MILSKIVNLKKENMAMLDFEYYKNQTFIDKQF